MSGPKCTELTVEENLRLVAMARAGAWDAVRKIDERIRVLAAAAQEDEIGVAILDLTSLRPQENASLTDIEAYAAALRNKFACMEREIERKRITRETSLMLSKLAEGLQGKITTSEEALAGHVPTQPASLENNRTLGVKERRQKVERAMARLSGGISEADRIAIQKLTEDALAASPIGRFEALMLALQVHVQHANEAARESAADAARAAELIAQLRGLEGTDVEEMRRQLEAIEHRELRMTSDVVGRVADVERAARIRADQRYAAHVIREEFERLGYEVEEGFETMFVTSGRVEVSKPSMKDYMARFEVAPAHGHFDVRLVRAGDPAAPVSQEQRQRDREAEEAWCVDFADILAGARKRKVGHRVIRHIRAGAEAMLVVGGDVEERRGRQAVRLKELRRN